MTGNRRENPDARVLVVVAEILLNRLLHAETEVATTPPSPSPTPLRHPGRVRLQPGQRRGDGRVPQLHRSRARHRLGTVAGAAAAARPHAAACRPRWATPWSSSTGCGTSHKRELELVKGDERKVPLSYHWVGDMLLTEQLEEMAQGDDDARMTPALVFCFNREECWTVAEQLKGKRVLSDGQQKRLVAELERYDWSQGAGPKLRQLLMRGVGVHHAGVLPKYRRIVEELFQRKLLSVAICTETLSAGINLPARSVVLPSIIKGPPDKKKLLEPSTAHQIFGRAGRPQFDKQGHVFVLAHEDDVKIARWREKYDQIPEDTKDPGLMKAKKALKKKMPTRRDNEQYWNEAQFSKLCAAPPGKLYSRGPLPWRLLAYMLDASPEVDLIRRLVGKRLMDPGRIEAGQQELDRMLMTLWRAGYVTLEPRAAERPRSWPRSKRRPRPKKAAAAKRLDFSFGFAEKKPRGRRSRRRTSPCWPSRRRTGQAARCSAASIRCTPCSW